jgi:hypothetical protein
MTKSTAGEWSKRAAELVNDKHLREQVARIMEPLRMIRGSMNTRTYEEIVQEIAQLVALLELKPDVQQTANVGGVSVVRGPMQGYGIMLHAADVYVMHMGNMMDDEDGPNRWHKAQEYWKNGVKP